MSGELREVVLQALHEFYCPMAHRDLVAYVRVFHEVDLSPEQLRTLLAQERQAHEAGEQRPVWVCPAILNHPGFPADDTLLTRSDWRLTARIVAAAGSEAIRQVWLTRRFCDMAYIALEERRPGAEVLVEQAARHAELLLPQGIARARLYLRDEEAAPVPPFDQLDWMSRLQFWSELAEDAHADVADVDLQARRDCAKALGQMSPALQLFGGARLP